MASMAEQVQEVVVVSGLPRSGTSMMMKMLEAGGLPVLTDSLRTPDDNNPKGYYEFERVKQLPKGDRDWLEQARGRVVKIISALLQHLPPAHRYRVVFMLRDLSEVLTSQRTMLARGNQATKYDDQQMTSLFQKHLQLIDAWLRAQPNFAILYVSYNDLMSEPSAQVARINRFFDGALDPEAMLRVVDHDLYRSRPDGPTPS